MKNAGFRRTAHLSIVRGRLETMTRHFFATVPPQTAQSESELVRRYKRILEIPIEAPIDAAMVRHHWELEQRLAIMILNSSKSDRWQVVKECYTTLYEELPWLNEWANRASSSLPQTKYASFNDFIGSAPKVIFEIGPGRCELLNMLAEIGHECRGAEITPERGERYGAFHSNLSFGITDGIHLNDFEPGRNYDVVITNHVIEHFHPNDIEEHFHSVYRILKPKGRYVLATPHKFLGPSGLEPVFDLPELRGLHLKEYTAGDLTLIAKNAGFRTVRVVPEGHSGTPRIFGLKRSSASNTSLSYSIYVLTLEVMLNFAKPQSIRRKLAWRLVWRGLFPRQLFLVAVK